MVYNPCLFCEGKKLMFILSRPFCEGIMIALFGGLISKKRPEARSLFIGICVLAEIASVLSLYIFVENSSYFFWHPYIVFLIANIADLAVYERGRRGSREAFGEKLLLWPLFIIPIISAFIMCTGWLIKLYWKNIFVFFGIK